MLLLRDLGLLGERSAEAERPFLRSLDPFRVPEFPRGFTLRVVRGKVFLDPPLEPGLLPRLLPLLRLARESREVLRDAGAESTVPPGPECMYGHLSHLVHLPCR